MKNSKFKIQNSAFVFLLFLTFNFALFTAASAQIAVKGETVWTMAGENITNGVVLLDANGKIEAVGTANQIKIPANYRVISAKVVTPGLIDAHTVIGLNGYLNQPQEQMALDGSSPMQPELRAIDAYNPMEKLIEWVRSFGVTTINTGHQPSALISGQTMIAKTVGNTADEAAIIPVAMVAVTLGEEALGSGGKSPGTRGKQAAMLRAELIRAGEAVRKGDDAAKTPTTTVVTSNGQNNNDNSPTATNPNSMLENPPTENNRATNSKSGQVVVARQNTGDLRSDIMQKVIRREIPLLITAHKAQDIITAIRLAKEFNVRIILDGVSEAQLVMNEIKASGFPVIVHPTMYRASGETEGLSLEDAAKLKSAGIPVALQSGYEGYVPKTRVVLFEAGVAAANGLSPRDALATITIDAAKILGLEKRLGSLEKGKDADVAMYDGDPFEYATHCIGTIINGKVVSETVR
ncbi:MAG: amidohydrolase family protein [Acidobacteriota bacterium]|nr:amidohydrolase family protein [Acidobacteriota bacterium]